MANLRRRDNFSGTGENTDRWNISGSPSDFPSGKNSFPDCTGFRWHTGVAICYGQRDLHDHEPVRSGVTTLSTAAQVSACQTTLCANRGLSAATLADRRLLCLPQRQFVHHSSGARNLRQHGPEHPPRPGLQELGHVHLQELHIQGALSASRHAGKSSTFSIIPSPPIRLALRVPSTPAIPPARTPRSALLS